MFRFSVTPLSGACVQPWGLAFRQRPPESLGGVAEDEMCVQITSKQQQKRQADGRGVAGRSSHQKRGQRKTEQNELTYMAYLLVLLNCIDPYMEFLGFPRAQE